LKFALNAGRALPPARVEALRSTVMGLDVAPDVHNLVRQSIAS
jgi:hypothetical protein